MDEGEIRYDISYIDSEIKSVPERSLPKELIFKFKDGKYLSEITGMFGSFKITNIVNQKKKTNLTYLQVLNKKYYYIGEPNEVAPGFKEMPGMSIIYENKVKNISGYNCKSAKISVPGSDNNSYTVYFTNKIPIKNPNSSNPYSEIDGVLLEFFLNLSTVEMKLSAKNVSFREIPSNDFKKRPDFKRVPREFITTVLDKIME